jgi:hypothetical protein
MYITFYYVYIEMEIFYIYVENTITSNHISRTVIFPELPSVWISENTTPAAKPKTIIYEPVTSPITWRKETIVIPKQKAHRSTTTASESDTSAVTWRKETIYLAKRKTALSTSTTSLSLKETVLKTTSPPLDPPIKSRNCTTFDPKEPKFTFDSSGKSLREPYPMYKKRPTRMVVKDKDFSLVFAMLYPLLLQVRVKHRDEEKYQERLLKIWLSWGMFLLEGFYLFLYSIVNVGCLYYLYPGLMGYKTKI